MYSSIRISGYRGLDSFRMEGLGRVNLLVGANNCGKTSILECIELLQSPGNPRVLASIVGRRGEWGYVTDEDIRASLTRQDFLDVGNLFANRELPGEIVVEANCVHDAHAARWNDRVALLARKVSEQDLEAGTSRRTSSSRSTSSGRARRTITRRSLPTKESWSVRDGRFARETNRAGQFSSSQPAALRRPRSSGRTASSSSHPGTRRLRKRCGSSSRPSSALLPRWTNAGSIWMLREA